MSKADVDATIALASLRRALARAARSGRVTWSGWVILALLSGAEAWTPLDLDRLAGAAAVSYETARRAVAALARAGAVELRPALRGHRREVRIPPIQTSPATQAQAARGAP